MTEATKEMAKQTSRMAEYTKNNTDASIEQFKIRSYPDFLVIPLECQLDLETRHYKIKIVNKNDIAAQKVSFVTVDLYNTRQHLAFKF